MTDYLRFVCFYSKLIIKTSLGYNCNSIVTIWKSVPSNDAFAYVGIVGNLFYVVIARYGAKNCINDSTSVACHVNSFLNISKYLKPLKKITLNPKSFLQRKLESRASLQ